MQRTCRICSSNFMGSMYIVQQLVYLNCNLTVTHTQFHSPSTIPPFLVSIKGCAVHTQPVIWVCIYSRAVSLCRDVHCLKICVGNSVSDPDPYTDPNFDDRTKLCWSEKNCNIVILWPPWRASKLRKKLSALQNEQLTLQNLEFLHFFLFLGHFCLPGFRDRPYLS